MRTVAAVVVTYNRKDLLVECIDSLLAQRLPGDATLDILVIDNASTDGTHEAVADYAQRDEVVYCNTGSNLGGAGGFNFGMRKAVECGYGYVWVMDDDCIPEPDALLALLDADAALDGGYGFLSSVVRWIDGTPCKMNIQRHPLTKDITDFAPDLQPVTLASFVSMFVRAEVVSEVGLPLKEFFIWTDDWEFTRRVSRKYPSYLVGKSIVTHASKTNGAGNIITDSTDRLDRYRLIYRNDMVLYRGEGVKGYLYMLSRGLYHLLQVLIRSDGQKLEKCRIIITSSIAGLRFHPEIEYPDNPSASALPDAKGAESMAHQILHEIPTVKK